MNYDGFQQCYNPSTTRAHCRPGLPGDEDIVRQQSE